MIEQLKSNWSKNDHFNFLKILPIEQASSIYLSSEAILNRFIYEIDFFLCQKNHENVTKSSTFHIKVTLYQHRHVDDT